MLLWTESCLHCQKWRIYKVKEHFLYLFMQEMRYLTEPVPTKAFLQPAATAVMCCHSEGDTHTSFPYLTFCASDTFTLLNTFVSTVSCMLESRQFWVHQFHSWNPHYFVPVGSVDYRVALISWGDYKYRTWDLRSRPKVLRTQGLKPEDPGLCVTAECRCYSGGTIIYS